MVKEQILEKIAHALATGQAYDAYVLASRELRQDLAPSLLVCFVQALLDQGQREEALIATLFTLSLFPESMAARALLERIKDPSTGDGQQIHSPIDSRVKQEYTSSTFVLWNSSESGSVLEKIKLHESSDRTEQLIARIATSCTVVGAEAIPVIGDRFIYCGGLVNIDPDVARGVVEEYTRALALSGIPSLADVPEIPGEMLTLVDRWAGEFWHWFTEKLPILIAAEASGYRGLYLIPPGGPYIAESLSILGIGSARTIRYTASAARCERLIIPDRLPGTDMHLYQQLFLQVRERLLGACFTGETLTRRIYISRNSDISRPRRLGNEQELLELIAPFKFERVALELLSLRDQIALMSQAEAIIAPHGAGMLHALFARERALVVELFPPDYINPCMLPVMKLLKHRYYMVPSFKNVAEPTRPTDEFYAFLAPVELALLREFST